MENEPKVEGSTCGTSALSAGLGVADPSCFNCDALGGGLYRVHEGPTQWFVGHADGGGQYACADCKDLLFDALPIATPNVELTGAGGFIACVRVERRVMFLCVDTKSLDNV